jgi:hypothetical protein
MDHELASAFDLVVDAYWATAWLADYAIPGYERCGNWPAARAAKARRAACAAMYNHLTGHPWSKGRRGQRLLSVCYLRTIQRRTRGRERAGQHVLVGPVGVEPTLART